MSQLYTHRLNATSFELNIYDNIFYLGVFIQL